MTLWPRPVPTVGDPSSATERAADPRAWRLSSVTREALYSVIHARRDIRRFRPDPVPEEILERVLGAAHAAPSVGHSQPWRFILVTEPATRERAALLADRERQAQASGLDPEAGRQMLDLQLEGIREAPIGIVVCCDRRAPAAGVLGRATFNDADVWSCICAIENLWLSARAEGLGVGWVTLFPPESLGDLVALPTGVEALGWLCLGWPDERPPEPGLARAGWSQRLPLDAVVMSERWTADNRPPPISRLRSPEPNAIVDARDEADRLLTSPGSLGVLDRSLDRLVALGVRGVERGALVLAAADHPVAALGVSTYPAAVTREVLEATVAGQSLGAAAARAIGFTVVPIDAGVDGTTVEGSRNARPTDARGDLVASDALSARDVERLVEIGREIGTGQSSGIIALGEVGIGNTTVAAALAAAMLDLEPAAVVGLGAGGDSQTLATKRAVVEAAVKRGRDQLGRSTDPLSWLGALGGPEIALLAGTVLGAASGRTAIVLDGLATSLAALCAVRLEPAVAAYLVAGQRSRERAHAAVLAELGLEPLLDLRLRAGEGVGALLACELLRIGFRARAGTTRVER